MGQELTQARLKELLDYEPETGVFTWKVARGGRGVGDVAGSTRKDGRTVMCLDTRLYLRHRCAWLYVYGLWPSDSTDHRSGNKVDDRVVNLRPCTHGENSQNLTARKGSKSGLLGVSWDKGKGRWHAQITKQYTRKHLGYFNTPEEAHQAYLTAKAQLHTFQPTPRITTT